MTKTVQDVTSRAALDKCRARYRRCTSRCTSKSGISGDVNPRDFVMAQNKARRHITQAQLAMATTSVYAWKPVGNPTFAQSHIECVIAKTNAELAEISGVHKNTITQAKAVQTRATPEVQEAVRRGEVGLPKAAAIVWSVTGGRYSACYGESGISTSWVAFLVELASIRAVVLDLVDARKSCLSSLNSLYYR